MHEAEQAAAQAIDDIFLSPRVVDAATLAEFAESLRGLIEQAAVERELLRSTVAAGETAAQTLTETSAKVSKKLRPALKLIPTLDERLAQAEDSLTRATDLAGVVEQAASDAATKRAKQLEAKLAQLTKRAETAIKALDRECKHQLELAADQARGTLTSLQSDIDTQATEAIGRLQSAIDKRLAANTVGETQKNATKPGQKAKATKAALQTAAKAEAEAAKAHAALQANIESVKSQADEITTSLDRRVTNATRRAKAATERAEKTDQLAQAAEARLVAADEQLRLIDERATLIAETTRQTLATFDQELTSRTHAIREVMEQLASVTASVAPADPHPDPDPVETRQSPGTAVEAKPGAGPSGLVRIDRPIEPQVPGGLPGRLRF